MLQKNSKHSFIWFNFDRCVIAQKDGGKKNSQTEFTMNENGKGQKPMFVVYKFIFETFNFKVVVF